MDIKLSTCFTVTSSLLALILSIPQQNCMSTRRTAPYLEVSGDSSSEEVENRKVMRPNVLVGNSMATSTSLNSIHISPRTPKSPRMGLDDAEEGVELSLLGEEERREALRGVEDIPSKRPIGAKDKRGMALLCVLCKCAL